MMGTLLSLLRAKSNGQGQEESGCVERGTAGAGESVCSPEQPRELHPAATVRRATLLEERAAAGWAWKMPWCGLWRSLLKMGLAME